MTADRSGHEQRCFSPVLRVGRRFFFYDAFKNQILETNRAGARALEHQAIAEVNGPHGGDAGEPSGLQLSYTPPAGQVIVRTIEFVPTGSCNLQCSYCATRDRYQRDDGTNDVMDESTALAALNLLRPYIHSDTLRLRFFGGEPLLAFQVIRRIVETLDGWGIATDKTLATNGILLNDESIDFLAVHRFLTLISLDGSPQVHDAHRTDREGRATYSRVVQNLKSYQARHPELFRQHVAINMVITPRFAGRFQEQVKHLMSLCISPDQINPNDTTGTASPSTRYTDVQIKRMQREKAAIRKEIISTGPTCSQTRAPGCYATYGGLTWPSLETPLEANDRSPATNEIVLEDCQQYAWNTFTVWPDGGISFCLEFARSAQVEFGNAHTGRLDMEGVARLQEDFRTSVVKGCRTCWAVRMCQLTGCCLEFVRRGCKDGWQRPSLCDYLRGDLVERLRDALRLHLQIRKEKSHG
jgi:radical SAM protein with 4Fe4S-binding SPASM domain